MHGSTPLVHYVHPSPLLSAFCGKSFFLGFFWHTLLFLLLGGSCALITRPICVFSLIILWVEWNREKDRDRGHDSSWGLKLIPSVLGSWLNIPLFSSCKGNITIPIVLVFIEFFVGLRKGGVSEWFVFSFSPVIFKVYWVANKTRRIRNEIFDAFFYHFQGTLTHTLTKFCFFFVSYLIALLLLAFSYVLFEGERKTNDIFWTLHFICLLWVISRNLQLVSIAMESS